MRFFTLLLLSLAALSANAATIAFKDIPSTNVVNTSDQLLLNSNLGGGNYATRTITVSALPHTGSTNWVDSGTTNATLAGVATTGYLIATNGLLGPSFTSSITAAGKIEAGIDADWANVVLRIPGFNGYTPGQYASLGSADTNQGGLNLVAIGDTNIASIILNAQKVSVITTEPLIELTGTELGGAEASRGKTIIGCDNDFAHLNNGGRWMLSITEGHGTYAGGYPDSVGFVGVNVTSALANLHVVNNQTFNDDTAKTNIVSLFEGRSDQTGDLAQWKLTGGSTLAKIDKDGALTTASYTSGAPSGGTAAAWKFGSYKTNAVTLVATNYVEVEIGGVLRKLAIVQ